MSATSQAEKNALTLPQRAAVALGDSANAAKLRELAAKSAGIVTVTNVDGRDEAHRAGMVLRRTRTDITSTGKAAREDATAFSKAVIAMEKDLIAIIEPEELRVLALRDGFDAEEKARKDALIAAERARVEAIQADIEQLRAITPRLIGKSADDLAFALRDMRSMKVEESRFAEFTEAAGKVVGDVIASIEAMHAATVEREAAALAAEQARIAEAARIEAERAELAKQRAENERIANEQAAERQRLADLAAAQVLAAKLLADKAASNLKADRDAQELAMRMEREKQAKDQAEQDRVAADTKRQLDAAQAAFAAERAAFVREQEEVAARAELAARLPVDHTEAMEMNATLDAAIANIAPVEVFAQVADLACCTATAEAMLTNGRSLLSDSIDAYVGGGLADDDAPVIDYEAIAWAYQKLLAFGVGNGRMDNALMLDRLNLMLMTAEVA